MGCTASVPPPEPPALAADKPWPLQLIGADASGKTTLLLQLRRVDWRVAHTPSPSIAVDSPEAGTSRSPPIEAAAAADAGMSLAAVQIAVTDHKAAPPAPASQQMSPERMAAWHADAPHPPAVNAADDGLGMDVRVRAIAAVVNDCCRVVLTAVSNCHWSWLGASQRRAAAQSTEWRRRPSYRLYRQPAVEPLGLDPVCGPHVLQPDESCVHCWPGTSTPGRHCAIAAAVQPALQYVWDVVRAARTSDGHAEWTHGLSLWLDMPPTSHEWRERVCAMSRVTLRSVLLECVTPIVHVCDFIASFVDPSAHPLPYALHLLWSDTAVRHAVERSGGLTPYDGTRHFLDRLMTIGALTPQTERLPMRHRFVGPSERYRRCCREYDGLSLSAGCPLPFDWVPSATDMAHVRTGKGERPTTTVRLQAAARPTDASAADVHPSAGGAMPAPSACLSVHDGGRWAGYDGSRSVFVAVMSADAWAVRSATTNEYNRLNADFQRISDELRARPPIDRARPFFLLLTKRDRCAERVAALVRSDGDAVAHGLREADGTANDALLKSADALPRITAIFERRMQERLAPYSGRLHTYLLDATSVDEVERVFRDILRILQATAAPAVASPPS